MIPPALAAFFLSNAVWHPYGFLQNKRYTTQIASNGVPLAAGKLVEQAEARSV